MSATDVTGYEPRGGIPLPSPITQPQQCKALWRLAESDSDKTHEMEQKRPQSEIASPNRCSAPVCAPYIVTPALHIASIKQICSPHDRPYGERGLRSVQVDSRLVVALPRHVGPVSCDSRDQATACSVFCAASIANRRGWRAFRAAQAGEVPAVPLLDR